MAVLWLVPAVALAHGQEILFLPIGNVTSLAAATVVACLVRVSWRSRAIAILLGIAAALPPWFLPNAWLPYWLPFSAVGSFLVGFVPPLAVSIAFLVWRQRASGDSRPLGKP